MADVRPALRLPLLVFGLLSLAAGVSLGLMRLGWNVPAPASLSVLLHGPLMISGFFGTVISLERAVALGKRWAYLAPLFTGLSAVGALLGLPHSLVATGIVLGSVVLLSASCLIYWRQRALFTLCLALGAFCWFAGNALWLIGRPVFVLLSWWMGFLILTIAGERLELSRVLPPSPRAVRIFGILVVALLSGIALSGVVRTVGAPLLGFAILALAGWLLTQDVARRTIRQQGLTRFIALCLLSGYVWLAFGGAIIVASTGLLAGSLAYDAAVHAILLGFVFSMVFGHAPIIFPAVLRVAVPFHWTSYIPLLVLHLSLTLRVAGDLAPLLELRRIGGFLNAIALALFVLNVVTAVIRGQLAARNRVQVRA